MRTPSLSLLVMTLMSISMFALGAPHCQQHALPRGCWPRNFAASSDGKNGALFKVVLPAASTTKDDIVS